MKTFSQYLEAAGMSDYMASIQPRLQAQKADQPTDINLGPDASYYDIKAEVNRWVKQSTQYVSSQIEGRDDNVTTKIFGFDLRLRGMSKELIKNHPYPPGTALPYGNGHYNDSGSTVYAKHIASYDPLKIVLEYKAKWETKYTPINAENLIEYMYKVRGS